MLETAILIVMVIVSLAIIGLILIQQGKGADMGASFGSGASNTVFGSQGSGNFLTHTTAILAAVFFVCCLALAWFGNNRNDRAGGIDFSAPEVQLKEVPAAPDVPNVAPAPAASDVPAASAEDIPSAEADAPVVEAAVAKPAGETAPAVASPDTEPAAAESAPAAAPSEQQKTE